MFKCQELSTKQFSPLWRSCEPHASLCKCGKSLKNRFQPPKKCYASRAGMFKCQERLRKQFSLLWKHCGARATLCMRGKDLIKPFNLP